MAKVGEDAGVGEAAAVDEEERESLADEEEDESVVDEEAEDSASPSSEMSFEESEGDDDSDVMSTSQWKPAVKESNPALLEQKFFPLCGSRIMMCCTCSGVCRGRCSLYAGGGPRCAALLPEFAQHAEFHFGLLRLSLMIQRPEY
ncbi:hypothetical protein GCK32_013297 [Trichostrongylus colubriformis]|uniref:Uncharacterized protein n=1 Tax=Trichostrongylus colubriformis TaxID=6319 RepID=A0AAN8FIK0_TRICO